MSGFLAKVNNRAAASTTRTTTSGQSSVARTAAKNITGSKTATGNVAGLRTSGAIDYGIWAKRSTPGSGAQYNVKGYNSASLSALRHFSIDGHMQLYNTMGGVYGSNRRANIYNVLGATAMTLGTLTKLTGQFLDAKSTSSTQSAGKTEGAGNSGTTGSLSKMKAAKDSGSLREAIEAAKADKTKMESDLKSLEAKLPDMKKASEAATKKLETLKPKLAQAKEEMTTAENNKKEAEGIKKANEEAVNNAETRLQGAKEGLTTAKQGLISAKQALGSAQSKLASVQSQLASTPQTITDANGKSIPNPAYRQAQEAVKQAEEQVRQAESNFDKASTEYNAANDDDKKAKSDYEKGVKQLANSEENLAKMTEKYNAIKDEHDRLEKEVKDANGDKTAYENAIKQQSELQASIKSLDSEISAQEKRLTELENKEVKGFDAAGNTILQMNNKLAGKDGILGTSDDKKKLKSKDQEKLNSAETLQRNVGYTKLYKQPPTKTINGKEFRTAPYNGETLYMIGARRVDAETYKKEMDKQNAATRQTS